MPRSPIRELKNANAAIERNLTVSESRGEIAQDILSHLRNLTEHLAVALVYGNSIPYPDYYEAIKHAINELPRKPRMRFLQEFHRLLQKSVSHYSPSQDDSQRLLLKYREYLFLCRDLASRELKVSILSGLDEVNWNEDPGLQEYYDLVFRKVSSFGFGILSSIEKDRYYVYSRKAIFSGNHLFYEYALVPAMDFTSKFDHVIAFSQDRIPINYAIAISIKHSSIPALGGTLPIMIIDDWTTSIRPCEINKLLKALGSAEIVSSQLNSYKRLMRILTVNKTNLLELCVLPDRDFNQLVEQVAISGKKTGVRELLERSRPFLLSRKPGSNILRYLLYRPRNKVIAAQSCDVRNNLLSGLRFQNGCIPFDKQPLCTSLIKHSPSHQDLMMCIDPDEYEDNLLAHTVSEKESDTEAVFIDQKEFESFQNVDALIESYNQCLYEGHSSRMLIHDMGQLFFKEAEDDLTFIIKELINYSETGIAGYRISSESKLASMTPRPDDAQKVKIAASMFDESCVALLYGSAGTGKTTLVNIICSLFANSRKIAVANTNPAVENLRRRIKDSRCEFMTIAKYLSSGKRNRYDLLVIDECSTVSNSDMKKILSRKGFSLLLLVGDTCQVESIRLGNWFDVARNFLGKHCTFQLEKSWRAANDSIKELWDSVRTIEDDIAERLVACNATRPLCEDIFDRASNDEIILCLNYDGLYGINNINRMLQSANRNEAVRWGLQTFKVDDPVLFNESGRFAPVLYNNLKGRISKLELINDSHLAVEVVVDAPLNALDVNTVSGLEFVESYPDGTTGVAFTIQRLDEEDGESTPESSLIPFQIAYAVSIHKAQGLEYDSVKVIVTKDVESRISHSIFYTAITRAKNHLTIFWSPETQEKVIGDFDRRESNKDAQLIARRNGIKLYRRKQKHGS